MKLKGIKDIKKKYIIVDFGEQKNDVDKYYVLRIFKVLGSDYITYDKFWWVDDGVIKSQIQTSDYSKLDIVCQYNSEEKAIDKLKFLYDTLKYNL